MKTEQKSKPEETNIESAVRETNLQGMRAMAGNTVASPQVDTFQEEQDSPRVVSVTPRKAASPASTEAARKAREAADAAERLARIAKSEEQRAAGLEARLADLPRVYGEARRRLGLLQSQLTSLNEEALAAEVVSAHIGMLQTFGLPGEVYSEAERRFLVASARRANLPLLVDNAKTLVANTQLELEAIRAQGDAIADELGVPRVDLSAPPAKENPSTYAQESRQRLRGDSQAPEAGDGRSIVGWENNGRPRPAHKGVSGSHLTSGKTSN
jgi:hypothetical protein